MVKKTKEEALETRNLLLDTAECVFNEKGVSGTTLADIASAAGVTRGAIYWHFKNKADLFEAMCERVRLPMETMIAAGAEDDVTDPIGELRKAADYFFLKVSTDPHHHKVFDILFNKCEFVEQLGPIMDRDERVRKDFRERFERIFINAVRLGQLPINTNVPLAVNAYLSYSKGIMRSWLLEPESFDLYRDGVRMMEGFLDMLTQSQAFLD
ncbi:MAG: TetR family transcriptional regulator [Ketobacter sp.]|nr:MAG: TetR family transcriptional regulator [Ketobacter sp.]